MSWAGLSMPAWLQVRPREVDPQMRGDSLRGCAGGNQLLLRCSVFDAVEAGWVTGVSFDLRMCTLRGTGPRRRACTRLAGCCWLPRHDRVIDHHTRLPASTSGRGLSLTRNTASRIAWVAG